MHESVDAWIGKQVSALDLSRRVTLEVGSYDVNGSVRPWFRGEYTGLDMREGPGVDITGIASDLPFPDESFDTVVCTELLEHDARPWLTFREIGRVLRPGGYLLLTARGYTTTGCFGVHYEPYDFWRFSDGAMAILAEEGGLTALEVTQDPQAPGWFLLAQKEE